MKKLSIVVPCYNEEETINLFYEEVEKVLKELDVLKEYIFVNDGSSDNTIDVIRKLALKDQNIRYISFSRNFGKEAAMYAGLKEATGDYVTTMDADLQDPPELLIKMFNCLEEKKYDCCAARSISRNGYSFFRKTFTKLFYRIIEKISKVEMVDGARDFRLMNRKMVDAIISMGEYNRYLKGMFGYVGFDTYWITYENKERVAGTTKWSFCKLFSYAIDGIVGYSTAPLVMAAIIGFVFFLISILMIIFIVFRTILYGDPVNGWPSLVCIIFMMSGIQLFTIGIIGEYLSKVYLETKKRPIYIIKETEKDLNM